MRTLTKVLEEKKNRETRQSQVDEDFHSLLLKQYNVDLSNSRCVNEYHDDLAKTIEVIKKQRETVESHLKQENVLSLNEDEKMQSFLKMLDILSAFRDFSILYKKEKNDKLKWIEKELIKSLNSVHYYVEQLASYISIHHSDILTDLQFPSDGFDNSKRLDTLLKQTDEMKELRKLLKDEIDFRNQTLTVRAIGVSVIDKAKKFMKIL